MQCRNVYLVSEKTDDVDVKEDSLTLEFSNDSPP